VSTPISVASFVAFFVALLACLELGRRRGRKAFASDATHSRSAGLASVEAVSFGLLGLLLAFTFSGAAARLDMRRTQIVDEANAIGTAWLRVDVLPASAQPGVRDAMRKYVDSRIAVYHAFSESGLDAAHAAYARSAALQNDVWTRAVAASRDVPSATVVLLPALNQMFDIAATRLAATEMHPPTIVYIVLALLSLVCAFLVGYQMGGTDAPSRSHIMVLAFILAFTFYVIVDFEYPRLGLIRVDDFDKLIAQVRASMG
jgi:hypothetical protein